MRCHTFVLHLLLIDNSPASVDVFYPTQCYWINKYHALVREVVGSELLEQNRTRGYEWVQAKTELLPCPHTKHVTSAGKSTDHTAALTDTKPGISGGDRTEALAMLTYLLTFMMMLVTRAM